MYSGKIAVPPGEVPTTIINSPTVTSTTSMNNFWNTPKKINWFCNRPMSPVPTPTQLEDSCTLLNSETGIFPNNASLTTGQKLNEPESETISKNCGQKIVIHDVRVIIPSRIAVSSTGSTKEPENHISPDESYDSLPDPFHNSSEGDSLYSPSESDENVSLRNSPLVTRTRVRNQNATISKGDSLRQIKFQLSPKLNEEGTSQIKETQTSVKCNETDNAKELFEPKGEQGSASSSSNVSAYNKLVESVYCRVILLNRKRSGELQRMLLHTYQSASERPENEEYNTAVSSSEQILLKNLKRVVIRGKRGRGVPVLFSKDVQNHIKGKSLDEIDVNLEENLLNHVEENDKSDAEATIDEDTVPDSSKAASSSSAELVASGPVVPKKGKNRTVVPWTTEQKKVAKHFFKHHIRAGKAPKKEECERLKAQHTELLKNKEWTKIKVFVRNEDDTILNDPQAIVDAFADILVQAFVSSNLNSGRNSDPICVRTNVNCLNALGVDENIVLSAIRRLKSTMIYVIKDCEEDGETLVEEENGEEIPVIMKRRLRRTKKVLTGKRGRPRKLFNMIEVNEYEAEPEEEENHDNEELHDVAGLIEFGDPQTVSEAALSSPVAADWKKAMNAEYEALK
ncbi:hypothetical protein MTP99_017260 [Tenebrio molitor]|nr:hypothetical protein MTP99_017260 [Tenebrio molitor]